ncbi:phosphate acyltransferase [Candidatus Latescibacterota bacterium]
MGSQKRIIDALSEISKSRVGLSAYERQLETASAPWLEHLSNLITVETDEDTLKDVIVELSTVIESLLPITGTPEVNMLTGKVLSLLAQAERLFHRSQYIMKRLLSEYTVDMAEAEKKRILTIKTKYMSTKISCFEGIEKTGETELHLSPDVPDSVNTRVDSILTWLADSGLDLSSFAGIACRCGFIQPIPSGTYRIVPEMLQDLEHPRFEHASNMSVSIVMKLAVLSGREKELLLTTSDVVVSDEIEVVERLTGFIKIKRDGSGAHYLNHKAVLKLLASMAGISPENFSAVTAHLGHGISVVLQRNNRVTALFDAFSGLPTTNRCGPLDLLRLIDGIKNDGITLKELESIAFSRGGLISLAGTNDFRTLDGFRHKGATALQQKKIELIYDFFARQIASAALKLTADGKPVNMMALTGGIARSHELVRRIEENIAGRYPVVLVPGSIELEALAAGLIRGFYEPESLKNYVEERDALKQKRNEEDTLIDTVIFDRSVIYRKKDAPIVSLDELIDDARITVKEHYSPSIAIVGADNEDAILAAKRANEEGNYRIATFKLVGDFTAINQIAYDFDLVIDNDNFEIFDTENPVGEATKLLDSGKAQILMKGNMHTDELLRGMFHFLKSTGRLKRGELISHVFAMDIPVRNKLLLISDAAVNPYPNEDKMVKIIENTLKVATQLNIARPKVAVISAIENVNLSVESSITAERVASHFADRSDCVVEGPISFDIAMNQKIALEKNYEGEIKGTADILIMPDIDAGNILYKSLTTQSGATSAGVILCGNMPLILTSRGDSARSKLASISLAVKLFFNLRED